VLNDHERERLNQRVPSQLMEATVLDPPLSEEGWLRVEVDAQPGVVQLCPWPDNGAVPSSGDAAAVMESDHGNYWVLGVWAQ
jgi:hypothetical protein